MSHVKDLATLLVKLREDKAASEKALSDIVATIEETERSLYLAMGEEGMSSAKFDDLGVQIVAVQKQFPRIKPEEKHREDEIFEWLRGLGHGDVIRLQIHPQTLRSTLKQVADEVKEMPDFIEVYTETGVTVRKA